ncbi:MAG: outer membrane beta-barrel protein [Alphaproteobacteria bacterium]|nr:outer membrane beta-barrel protein [Alphaproteobacteria bacterium]
MNKISMRLSLAVAVSVIALAGTAVPAHANYNQQGMFGGRQDPDGAIVVRDPVEPSRGAEAGVSVAGRPRPEFDPIPINIGSFQMFPSLELGAVYDSNVFAENLGQNEGAHDVIWTVRPAVSFFSNWNRHALSFAGQGDIAFYTDRDKEQYSDGILTTRGRFDIRRGSFITYGADYQRLTEQRSSPDNTITNEPSTFNYYQFLLGNTHQQGRFGFKTHVHAERFDFDPTSSATVPVISLDARDRAQYVTEGEVNYQVMGFWKPFIRGSYNWRDYDNNATRNSQGYSIVGGTGFELSSGIFTGEVFVGHMAQDFRNITPGGDTSAGLRFGGNVLWNVTNLTSIEGNINRTIEETTLTGFRSYTATGGSITVTHELMRNLLLEGNFDIANHDFQGGVTRVDDNYRAGFGGRYFFTRNFYGDLEYNYSARTSDVSGAEYDRHTVALRVGAQM